MNGPVLSFSGPANSLVELTGLVNAGEKGWRLGAWEPMALPALVAPFGKYPVLRGPCSKFQDVALQR